MNKNISEPVITIEPYPDGTCDVIIDDDRKEFKSILDAAVFLSGWLREIDPEGHADLAKKFRGMLM